MALNILLWHWGRGGGGTKFTLELADALMARGDTNIHLTLSQQGEGIEVAQSRSYPVLGVDTFKGSKLTWKGRLSAAASLPRNLFHGRRFKHYLEEERIDLVLCTMQTVWDFPVLPILRRAPCRFAMIVHDVIAHPGEDNFLRNMLLRKQAQCTDGLLVLSDHVARSAREIYSYPSDRIWQIEHGAFDYGAGGQTRSFPQNRRFRLQFFGRLVTYKGLDLLLDAYALMEQAGLPIELHIAGCGDISPYRTKINRLRHVQVDNRWIPDEDIESILRLADLLVLPYVESSQSGVIPMAYAAGLPVVATPVGGLVEQVQDGQTGLLARAITPEAVAEAIGRYLSDPVFYEASSITARQYAETELSWVHVATDVYEVCRRLIALPRRHQV